MPGPARRVAAERLRRYADQDCRPQNRQKVLGLADSLESVSEAVDERLMRDFMLFTNDLDVSRGQRFADTHQELLGFILRSGFQWTNDTRYAGSAR